MSRMGMAIMGTGVATGEDRARLAATAAISSPLLEDASVHGARGVIINVTGGPDLTLPRSARRPTSSTAPRTKTPTSSSAPSSIPRWKARSRSPSSRPGSIALRASPVAGGRSRATDPDRSDGYAAPCKPRRRSRSSPTPAASSCPAAAVSTCRRCRSPASVDAAAAAADADDDDASPLDVPAFLRRHGS